MNATCQIMIGDVRERLKEMPSESVQCCVTSPPFFGLRDYGVDGQIGMENSPQDFVNAMVDVFAEVRRLLKDDGTLWINLGDSFCSQGGAGGTMSASGLVGGDKRQIVRPEVLDPGKFGRWNRDWGGAKAKDLLGIPWRVAFALQAAGWWLRSDIIWAKPNCMPESVTDRPTRSHEYIFLMTKSERYYYDHEAIKEPCSESSEARYAQDVDGQIGSERANGGAKTNGTMKAVGGPRSDKQRGHSRRHDGFNGRWDDMERAEQCSGMRNKRDVWTIPPASYADAHFATYPPDLIRPCILAGSRIGDTILDPFAGSGTTGQVALEYGRNSILIDLNPKNERLMRDRIAPYLGQGVLL